MSASVNLIFPEFPIPLVTLLFTATIILSEILIPYQKYVMILKYLTLSLLAYVVTALIIGQNWQEVLTASIIPHVEFTPAFSMMFVALWNHNVALLVFLTDIRSRRCCKKKIKEWGKENHTSPGAKLR